MPQVDQFSLLITFACLAGMLTVVFQGLRDGFSAGPQSVRLPTVLPDIERRNWLLSAGKLPPKVNRPTTRGSRKPAGGQLAPPASRGQRATGDHSRDDVGKEQKWLALLDVDLSRITLAGWALLFSTFGVMLVGTGILVSLFPDAQDQIPSRAGKRIVTLPIVAAMAGWFAGGRKLLLNRGFVLIRPRK